MKRRCSKCGVIAPFNPPNWIKLTESHITTYTITNPYDAYNYYMNKNQQNEGKEVDGQMVYDSKDLIPLRNYLSGSGSINSFKNSIDSDVSKFAKKGKKVKITYVNKDSKLLISKIR